MDTIHKIITYTVTTINFNYNPVFILFECLFGIYLYQYYYYLKNGHVQEHIDHHIKSSLCTCCLSGMLIPLAINFKFIFYNNQIPLKVLLTCHIEKLGMGFGMIMRLLIVNVYSPITKQSINKLFICILLPRYIVYIDKRSKW